MTHRFFWTMAFVLLCAVTARAGGDEVKIYREPVAFAPFQTEYVKLLSVEQLSSTDSRFGGLSGLVKTPEGYLSVSDRGVLFTFEGERFDRARLIPLRGGNGKLLKGKRRKDSESLALAPDGSLYISFERNHRVVRYARDGSVREDILSFGREEQALVPNHGIEALEVLRDGTLLLVVEGQVSHPFTAVWLVKDGQSKRFDLPLKDGFRPTGVVRLPQTDNFVLLERYYKPLLDVKARLSYLNVSADSVTRGAVLAEFSSPTPVDNFEGIAAHEDTQGRLILSVLSDDNFSLFQRTLLLRILLK